MKADTLYKKSLRDLQLALAQVIQDIFSNGVTKTRTKKHNQIERAIYRLKRMHDIKK